MYSMYELPKIFCPCTVNVVVANGKKAEIIISIVKETEYKSYNDEKILSVN